MICLRSHSQSGRAGYKPRLASLPTILLSLGIEVPGATKEATERGGSGQGERGKSVKDPGVSARWTGLYVTNADSSLGGQQSASPTGSPTEWDCGDE